MNKKTNKIINKNIYLEIIIYIKYMEGYIEYLTDKNIENLTFQDLYKKYNTLDATSMNLKELMKLKQKIINFKVKPNMNMVDVIYSNILYLERQYKQLIIELNNEYGNYSDFIKSNNELQENSFNEEYKNIKNEKMNLFKKILRHNINFIINNRERILKRIEDVYEEKSKLINEEQKEKRSQYNQKEEVKLKRNQYCSEKIKCDCGFVTARKNLARHQKSNLHTKKLL